MFQNSKGISSAQRFPPSDYGRGAGTSKADDAAMTAEVKKESKRPAKDELLAPLSQSIDLGLEIGTNSVGSKGTKAAMVHRPRESVLTISQLYELQHQVLIHKHLAAGLRVPTHLLIPIWNSAARNSVPKVNGIYNGYRSFIGFNPRDLDFKSMMDPEPGRCRRTDGKKWRCGRDTIPHQKYCERHVHRGRQRSRKPVEDSSNTILLNNPESDVGCTVAAPAAATCRINETKNHFSRDFPIAITFSPITEGAIPSPKRVPKTITSSTHATTAILISCADATKTITMVPSTATNTTATRVTMVPGINPTATTSINMNGFGRNNINVEKIPSPALGLSPNSVLQVPGYSSSCNDSKLNTELERGRCRRTDGKKWRCRRDVIQNQKYCELHMHRGSKRHMKETQKMAVSTNATTSAITPISSGPTRLAMPATLNTNLSMAMQVGDKQWHNEERSNVSSSSETTITDTTITA